MGHLKSLLSEPNSQGLRAALRELLTNARGPEDPVYLESPSLPCSFTGGSSTTSEEPSLDTCQGCGYFLSEVSSQ